MPLTKVPGSILANTGVTAGVYSDTTIAIDSKGRISSAANGTYSQSAFNKANTVGDLAQAAFDKANTGTSTSTDDYARNLANSTLVTVNHTSNTVAAAFTVANSASLVSQINSGILTGVLGVDLAQNNSISNVNTLAQNAYNQANTKLSKSGGTITGSLTVDNNITVAGNLLVLGTTVSVNTSSTSLNDSLIFLANNNIYDSVDIGIVGQYKTANATSNLHTGIIRDSLVKDWIFFENYVPEIAANTLIDVTDASFTYSNVAANYFKGNLIGKTVTANGVNLLNYIDTVYASSNSVFEYASAAYNSANNNFDSITNLTGITSSQNQIVTNLAQAAYNLANNTHYDVVAANSYMYSSYSTANSANSLAQQALNLADTVNTISACSIIIAVSADNMAVGAFAKANSANILAQAAYNTANTSNNLAQQALTQAVSANDRAVGAFAKANTVGDYLSSNVSILNSRISNTNMDLVTGLSTKVDRIGDAYIVGQVQINSIGNTALQVIGNATTTGSLSVGGNLYVTGNVTSVSSNNLILSDSLLYLAENNPGNLFDIGLVGSFTTDKYQHTGIIRDHNNGRWKFFSNVVSEPTTTINWNQAVYDNVEFRIATCENVILNGADLNSILNSLTLGGAVDSFARSRANTNANNITTVNNFAAGAYASSNTNATNISAVNNFAAGAYASSNTNATNITAVNNFAAGAYAAANASFLAANTKLSSSGGTITGNLAVTQTVSAVTFTGNVSAVNVSTTSMQAGNITTGNVSVSGTIQGRVIPKVVSTTSTTSLTINANITDQYNVTALASGLTINIPTGTVSDGQKLTIRIKDNGVSRSLSWTTTSGGFRTIGLNLPSSTTAGGLTYVGCVYNSSDSYWDVIAVAQSS